MLTHQFIYLFLINVFFTNFALQPLKLYVFYWSVNDWDQGEHGG